MSRCIVTGKLDACRFATLRLPVRFIDKPDGAGLAPLPLSALVTALRRLEVLTCLCNALEPAMCWLTRWELLR